MVVAASPVSPKFVLVKWVYIIREEDSNEVKMRCFDVSKVYDEESCYLNDYPIDLKFSDGDSKKFGSLIKLGYQLYFKCISSVMYTEEEEKKPYQTGFLCIRVPHTKSFETIIQLLESDNDYTFRCLEDFPWPCDYLDYDKL